ncbi:MAG: FAD binding domain-containing protein [bacterium]
MNILRAFEYFAPISLPEAISLLEDYGLEAKVLAGGTDLIVWMKRGILTPSYVIDLKRIPGIDYIRYDEAEGLRIGALTALADLASSPILRERYPAIAEAAESVGSPQVRNRATIGGNLCNASPSADLAPPLIALNATAKISGPRGERTVPLEDFFTGPGKTVLTPAEVLTEVSLPAPPTGTGSAYIKHTIRRADIAIVGVAASLSPEGRVCLALGAAAPTPIRAREAESLLGGREISEKLLGEAAERASAESLPISDIRASEWYRREIVKILTVRAVRRALERAGEKVKEGGAQ